MAVLSRLCAVRNSVRSDHEALNVKQTFSAQASLLHSELKTLFWINEQQEHLFTVGEGLEQHPPAFAIITNVSLNFLAPAFQLRCCGSNIFGNKENQAEIAITENLEGNTS